VPKSRREIQPAGGSRSISRRSRHLRAGKSSSYSFRSCSGWRIPLLKGVALFLLVVVTLYLHPEWLSAFLQGPQVATRPRQPSEQQQQQQQQRPEDPRPITEEIFTAFTTTEKKRLKKMRQLFLEQKEEDQLVPCRLDGDCQSAVSGGQSNFVVAFLRGSSSAAASKVKLHNPVPFHRYFCNKVIWANGGTLELEESEISECLSGAKMPYVHIDHTPPLSGKNMDPIELFWNYDSMLYYNDDGVGKESFQTEEFPCPIPCRIAAGDWALLNIISIKDTKWEILSTMEGEKYYGQAKVKAKSHRHDQYYAVTSFESDIPLPYFSWAEYNIQHAAVDFDKAIKGASFLAKNCDSDNKREELVLALMETSLRVDSLSRCHNNAEPPQGVDMENKTAIQERYIFHLAFENQRTEDYITEKLWGALAAGTLPVYFGAPNIKEHVPPHSVVIVDDFASPQDLADHLIRLSKDKALYESYHTWRYKPVDPGFRQKYEFTNTHSTCRICKWAYAKKHGLGWNHTRQEIEEPLIPHKTCRNKVGLIGHPFKEYWLSESGENSVSVESMASTKTCTLEDSNRLVRIDGGVFQRKVYDHDGVTDIVIDALKAGSRYQLKLVTPMVTYNLQQLVEGNAGREWWLQDTRSRMTILTSAPVEMNVVKQGTVQFLVSSYLRIRVIVEDVDNFHKGAKKHANSFGDLMKHDFFSPIEAYKVIPKK
jgi:hypothetical protein